MARSRKVKVRPPQIPVVVADTAAVDADHDAWIQVGARLRRLDPERFDRLLHVAREVVRVHQPAAADDVIAPPRWGSSGPVLS